jgi:hypothetical protein
MPVKLGIGKDSPDACMSQPRFALVPANPTEQAIDVDQGWQVRSLLRLVRFAAGRR